LLPFASSPQIWYIWGAEKEPPFGNFSAQSAFVNQHLGGFFI